jgi:hypothetical protein
LVVPLDSPESVFGNRERVRAHVAADGGAQASALGVETLKSQAVAGADPQSLVIAGEEPDAVAAARPSSLVTSPVPGVTRRRGAEG